jgi:hypothetical protein
VLALEVEGPEATYVGQALNYRVTVRNTGDAAAEKTVLRLNSVGGTERIGDPRPRLDRPGPGPHGEHQHPRRA